MNNDEALEYLDEISAGIISYLESLVTKKGNLSHATHRDNVLKGIPEALMCEEAMARTQLGLFELHYVVIEKKCADVKLYCKECGKRIKRIKAGHQYCSHKCASNNAEVRKQYHDTRAKFAESIERTYGKIDKTKAADPELSEVREHLEELRTYMNSILDSTGSPNSSIHYRKLREKDPAADLTQKILVLYGIDFKELNFILGKNGEGINFYCPTCGKRLSSIFLDHCSTKCAARDPNVIEKIKATFLEKYGSEYFMSSEEGKAKSRARAIEKYGDLPQRTEEVKKKVRQTCLERYGETSSWKSPGVISKITASRMRTNRTKLYPLLVEFLKSRDLLLLSSYEEYLDAKTVKIRCLKCGHEFEPENSPYLQYFATRIICEKCYEDSCSNGEDEVYFFIKRFLPTTQIIRHSRKVLDNKAELDIYLPEFNFAIEYDGLYWHSSNRQSTDKNYHANKTHLCEEKGINLLHVFENEWIFSRDIVESIIKSRLGIYGRVCMRESAK